MQKMTNLESKILSNVSDQFCVWTKPEEFDLSDRTDKRILETKFDNNEVWSVIDRVEDIAEELFKINNPESLSFDSENTEYVKNILGQGMRYGKWFYFPWSRQLVHFPPVEEHRRLKTARNRNLITEDEQRILR